MDAIFFVTRLTFFPEILLIRHVVPPCVGQCSQLRARIALKLKRRAAGEVLGSCAGFHLKMLLARHLARARARDDGRPRPEGAGGSPPAVLGGMVAAWGARAHGHAEQAKTGKDRPR